MDIVTQEGQRRWSEDEIACLKQFVSEGLSVAAISIRMKRSKKSIWGKLYDIRDGNDQPYPESPWTAERIASLKTLWAEGNSATAIGIELGASRSAVLGKVHRLGLPGRLTTVRRYKPARPSPRRRAPRKPKSGQAKIIANLSSEPLPEPDVTDIARVKLQDLQEHHCRWPSGDPVEGFCGHQKVEGLPYCETHARRAYEAPAAKAQRKRKREQRKTFTIRKDRKLGVIGYV